MLCCSDQQLFEGVFDGFTEWYAPINCGKILKSAIVREIFSRRVELEGSLVDRRRSRIRSVLLFSSARCCYDLSEAVFVNFSAQAVQFGRVHATPHPPTSFHFAPEATPGLVLDDSSVFGISKITLTFSIPICGLSSILSLTSLAVFARLHVINLHPEYGICFKF